MRYIWYDYGSLVGLVVEPIGLEKWRLVGIRVIRLGVNPPIPDLKKPIEEFEKRFGELVAKAYQVKIMRSEECLECIPLR